ncbi:amidohydrolase family protein [Chloroflexota bacterium]
MLFIDSEVHAWPPMDDINYYPNFKKYVDTIVGFHRTRFLQFAKKPIDWQSEKTKKEYEASVNQIRARAYSTPQADVESLIASMDDGGVQMACVITEGMIDLSHGHRVRSTNGWIATEISKYPDRLLGIANLGPILKRGIDSVIWELEYLVKDRNFKACKIYPPDEGAPNCRDLWPFYNKVRELGIPLFVHTGFSWCAPGLSAPCHPLLLEEVCLDFPEMPIIAFHMGFPYQTELNLLSAKYDNLYIQTSLLPRFGLGYTKKTQEFLGEALAIAGPDKLIWGTDWSGSTIGHKEAVEFLESIQIAEELQHDYHYPVITQEIREQWAGLNLAKILKLEI